MILSLYDLTGIQRYVFSSNVLRENLGGSWLAHVALEDCLSRACEQSAKLLWSGGGNAMVSAGTVEDARAVATRLSATLASCAPDLGLVCAHVPWDGREDSFASAHKELRVRLDSYKQAKLPDARFDGGGVTAACASTGEPAVVLGGAQGDRRWLGPSALARMAAADNATQRLRQLFAPKPMVIGGRTHPLVYCDSMDTLGRTAGERSLLGVIHVDGNGMGKRFERVQGSLAQLQELSRAVNLAGQHTLQRALCWLHERLPGISDPALGGFALHARRDGSCVFPVRPIVFGGDDITLVCDGRLALDLAAETLRIWNEETANLQDGAAHACAGVALVPAHYPFFRAYGLSEELCRNAKRWLTAENLTTASALDWEFVPGGAVESLDERRERTALVREGAGQQCRLYARPYVVLGNPPPTQSHRSWSWLRDVLIEALQRGEGDGRGERTRAKSLAATLHRGREATREYLGRWQGRGWSLPAPEGHPLPDGFVNAETPYLDAVELMDIVLPRACFTLPAGAAPEEA